MPHFRRWRAPLVAGFALLAFAGCGGSSSHAPPFPGARHAPKASEVSRPSLRASSAGSQFGLDWAWGTPSNSSLHAIGVKFAAGYISYDSGKNLSVGEINSLHASGITTVLVWETTANRAGQGYAAGRSDATSAYYMAQARGNRHRPIFFAIDFDASGAQVLSYFQGAYSILGARTGAYGGYFPLRSLIGWGLITPSTAWQTYAWSLGLWGAAHLEQYSNGHSVGGVDTDYDRGFGDFGQWPIAAPKPPGPTRAQQIVKLRAALLATHRLAVRDGCYNGRQHGRAERHRCRALAASQIAQVRAIHRLHGLTFSDRHRIRAEANRLRRLYARDYCRPCGGWQRQINHDIVRLRSL